MYFCHAPEIWQQFPQLAAGVLVVNNINADTPVEARLEPWFERARQRLNGITESQLPEIAAWRRAYTRMGLKPTQYRSAGESLLRRFRQQDVLPRLHPLVDLCNAVSLAFALPVAVFDLVGISGYLEVRPAVGTETYLAFGDEVEIPPPGEIIFADAAANVHARRWTFRQSRTSTINAKTRQALIVSEGLHETAGEDVAALIEILAQTISALWGPPSHKAMVTANYPRLTFSF